MEMFIVSFFVKDADLAKVKRLLAGKVMNMKDEPVVNAAVNGSKVVAKTSGRALDMFAEYLKGKKTITNDEIREFLTARNRSAGSWLYLRNEAVKAGLLKRSGKTIKVVMKK